METLVGVYNADCEYHVSVQTSYEKDGERASGLRVRCGEGRGICVARGDAVYCVGHRCTCRGKGSRQRGWR